MQRSLTGQKSLKSAPRVNNGPVKLHKLANGLTVRHTSDAAEVEFLYREQFVDRTYLQHKVSLQPGAVVIDCGANIGLFAMSAAEAAGDAGLVLCCEPAPAAVAALEHNLQQHAAWSAAAGKKVARCIVVPEAVSNQDGQAVLTVYSRAAGWSTLVRDDDEVVANMQIYMQNLVSSSSSVMGDDPSRGWSPLQRALLAAARSFSSSPLLRPASRMLEKIYVEKVMMGEAQSVTVDTSTIGQIVERFGLGVVDLLKVDVERGELKVLQGVEQHWPKIRQVAMEVHAVDGGLESVVQLLRRDGGFSSVVVEQSPQVKGSTLFNVYATRGPQQQSTVCRTE